MNMKDWVKGLCPEIADWQADIIAEQYDNDMAELREKVVMYETLLHKIQLHAQVTMNSEAVHDLIGNICNWSYAHRCGNGEHSDEEQDALVRSAFLKLLDRK